MPFWFLDRKRPRSRADPARAPGHRGSGRPLVYTSCAKTHVTLGFARGSEIGDGLQGTGRSPIGKTVVKKGAGVPEAFDRWLEKALALDEVGE